MSTVELEKLQRPIADFSGGWNCRDAPEEVADNETPDAINMTLDERGGASKRLGLQRLNGASALASSPKNQFYWKTADVVVAQVGTGLYESADGGATWAVCPNVVAMSTSDTVGFAEFKGDLIVVHRYDGVFTYTTGDVWTNRNSTVKGQAVDVWLNYVWVGGPDSPRVWRSAIGDVTTWDTSGTGDWVDIRDGDDSGISAIGVGQNMDVLGRPGLLISKSGGQLARIYDSSTLAYTLMHRDAGAEGPLSLATVLGITVFLNRRGLWVTDGVKEPERVSQRIEPLFTENELNFTTLKAAAGGVYQDRVVFSIPRGSAQATNNFTLEYQPKDGWVMPHNFGASCFAVYSKGAQRLLSASPTAGYVRRTFASGADEGTAVTSHFQTPWYRFNEGAETRVRRLLLGGRGSFNLYVKRNYEQGQGTLTAVNLEGNAGVWNAFNWNDGTVWGPIQYEDFLPIYSLGVARAFGFRFTHTGTTSATAPKLLGDGYAREIGAFAVYSMLIDHIRLGGF